MPKRTLTQFERMKDRYEVIALVEEKMISVFDAAQALNISIRHAFRLLARFRQHNRYALCFEFKKRGCSRKKRKETVGAVLNLKREKPGRSIALIAERVSAEYEEISRATVRKILKENGLYQRREPRKKPYRRFEADNFGSLWQMDTCEGYWLPDFGKVHLALILDDYSRVIVGAEFVDSDSTWNNMCVIRGAVESFGIPRIFYTDNDSKFKTIRHQSRFYEFRDNAFYQTEIQRVLFELGVVPLTHQPYQPQAKGKIERLFRFVQDRFVPEHTAETLEELNQQFKRWVKWYNTERKHKSIEDVPMSRREPDATREIPKETNLDDIFCFTEVRMVRKDNAISFNGKEIFLNPKEYLAGREVELHVRPEKIRVFYRGNFIQEVCLI